MPENQWNYTQSIKMIQRLMTNRMYPLTLEGLDGAMKGAGALAPLTIAASVRCALKTKISAPAAKTAAMAWPVSHFARYEGSSRRAASLLSSCRSPHSPAR